MNCIICLPRTSRSASAWVLHPKANLEGRCGLLQQISHSLGGHILQYIPPLCNVLFNQYTCLQILGQQCCLGQSVEENAKIDPGVFKKGLPLSTVTSNYYGVLNRSQFFKPQRTREVVTLAITEKSLLITSVVKMLDG